MNHEEAEEKIQTETFVNEGETDYLKGKLEDIDTNDDSNDVSNDKDEEVYEEDFFYHSYDNVWYDPNNGKGFKTEIGEKVHDKRDMSKNPKIKKKKKEKREFYGII